MSNSSRSSNFALMLLAGALLDGCVATHVPGDDAGREEDQLAAPHAFALGMSNEVDGYEHFLATAEKAGTPVGGPRLCHVYTYWDVAEHDANPGHRTLGRAGLLDFFAAAEATCDEVLVSFQGPQNGEVTTPPSADAYEAGFAAFLAWAEPGAPLSAWSGRLAFTAWNEPNNPASDGNALLHDLTPEQAAEYYLRARKHCFESAGCTIAAGDFATNGTMADDIGRNCADDQASGNTTTRCAAPSEYSKGDDAPTYVDRYKTHIVRSAASNGLGASFRPEHWAYHPWHDVNAYLDDWATCSSYEDCATRRMLASLTGPWQHADIWDTEIGLGLQNASLVDNEVRQPCAAAFLERLTQLSPRFSRLYFMKFEAGNGPLLASPTSLRNAGRVLAGYETTFSPKGATCAPTGLGAE